MPISKRRQRQQAEKTFNIAEASRLTGMPLPSLRQWVQMHVIPLAVTGSRGYGRGHRLSFMSVFAVMVNIRYRSANSSTEWAQGIARFLSRITPDELEREFRAGRTVPIPARLVYRQDRPQWIPGRMVDLREEDRLPELGSFWEEVDLPTLYHRARQRMGMNPFTAAD